MNTPDPIITEKEVEQHLTTGFSPSGLKWLIEQKMITLV
jgi:hypothetical protein